MAISKILHMKDCGSSFHGKHLKSALEYITVPEKTQNGRLVSAINCQVDNAFEQMKETKKKFNKTDKRQAYHIILSFKEGEVSPDTVFELTERFVKEYLGNDYEAVFAVHDNTEHPHSHIVFNSVSFRDGKKYHYQKGDWEKYIQPITNRLCKEYGLSTIELDEESGKRRGRDSYQEWNSYRDGKFVWSRMVARDVDACIIQAASFESFVSMLENKGYEVKNSLNEKLEKENREFTEQLEGKQNEVNKGLQTIAQLRTELENLKKEMKIMQDRNTDLEQQILQRDEKRKYEEEYETLYNDISAKLYTGGYQIYTSINMDAQAHLQSAVDENLAQYTGVNDEGVYEFQGAATCIDNATGKVVAIVGGRSQEYKGYTLNRAYQSYRQPGSSIKPILDYTPLLERNFYPETMVRDEPIESGPVNSPDVYEGDITLRYAVEKSKNTIAWKYFTEMSADTCLTYLKNMDFKKIVPEDYVPPVSIGGMTYGVSALEMASAYTTLENEGIFRSPTCITKITDASGNIIIDNIDYEHSKTTTIEKKQIYQTNACRMMTDMLKGVLISGTGRNYNIGNAICAAKTGTTNENKDVWFVGYSRYYTTAVWVGYDMPKEINDNYGNTCSGKIWNNFMTYMHTDLPVTDFPPYIMENGASSNGEPVTEETTTEEETEPQSVYTEETPQPELTVPTEETPESVTAPETKETEEFTEETTTYYSTTEGYTSDNVAPGGADGGVYQEYWGE